SEAIATAAAIWRIGAVSSPIVPLSGVAEVSNVLQQVRPAAIIAVRDYRSRTLTDELDEALAATGFNDVARLLVQGSATGWSAADGSGPGAIPDHVQPSAPHEPCLVLFTSGTESAAKGVL